MAKTKTSSAKRKLGNLVNWPEVGIGFEKQIILIHRLIICLQSHLFVNFTEYSMNHSENCQEKFLKNRFLLAGT